MQSLAMFGAFIGFGVSIIYMLIFSILSAYMMLGQNLIYLDVTSDMNFDDVNAQFNEVTSKVKSNIDKYKEKAASMSAKNTSTPSGENFDDRNSQPPQTSVQSGGKFCTACGAKNPSDALFCENCGSKLR